MDVFPTANTALKSTAEALFVTAAQATVAGLKRVQGGEETLVSLVTNAVQLVDQVIAEVLTLQPAAGRPACAVDCAACCYLPVAATPLEVLALAEWWQAHADSSEQAILNQRLTTHIQTTACDTRSDRQRLRVACPLLAGTRCTVYSLRPITCRGWNSLSRLSCDADYANPAQQLTTPIHSGQMLLASHVLEGLRAGANQLGLEHRLLDFARGLERALIDPTSMRNRWLAGEPVFAGTIAEEVFPATTMDTAEERARAHLWALLDVKRRQ